MKGLVYVLARFLGSYFLLLFLYSKYLSIQRGLDIFSLWVASQVVYIQNVFGYRSVHVPVEKYETSWFYTAGQYTTRMVEGCNAVSIMILFVSFVLAFFRGVKSLLFLLAGLVIIHCINIVRIAMLNIIYIEKKEWIRPAHDYLFPLVIYGTVVLLWIMYFAYFFPKKQETEV